MSELSAVEVQRRWPVGAEVSSAGTHFRVWAPTAHRVAVVFDQGERDEFPLNAEEQGYFSGLAEGIGDGARYRLRLDDRGPFPDPASRFQPEGPHGPSQVIDPRRFDWSDSGWRGMAADRAVLYEMHIGTFTPEGNYAAAQRELPELARLGITVLEVMPVADFCGRFGWGYDGVNLYAPTRLYGHPDDLRRFVDAAHAQGIAVILDVVYNHLGPDGNFLSEFSPHYFTKKYANEWGDAINFDGEQSEAVREFFVANAGYWIDEFHLDGLRLDATQQIYDDSQEHILAEITRVTRKLAGKRSIYVVAENEPQHTRMVRPVEHGGYGIDALWNDDFHHSAMVALTGRNEAYYTDYLGKPQEFISAAKYGYLYQGQRYKWQKNRRGTSALDLSPDKFVTFIQNHDQIANSGHGLRVHRLTSPGRYKALTALLLLGPASPMLFQGQEFASSRPFFYFADHKPELAELVFKGRKEFFRQFRSLALPEVQAVIPDPAGEETFRRCQLDLSEREKHAEIYRLHIDLLALRRNDVAFRSTRHPRLDGAVLGEHCFVLRFLAPGGSDRLLLVNLGRDLHLAPAPEPLLAPPGDCRWTELLGTEELQYGGGGLAPVETEDGWRIPGEAAVVLAPQVIES